MVDYHTYCGPSFYTDRAMNNLYEPIDENDPVWEAFSRWYDTKPFRKNSTSSATML